VAGRPDSQKGCADLGKHEGLYPAYNKVERKTVKKKAFPSQINSEKGMPLLSVRTLMSVVRRLVRLDHRVQEILELDAVELCAAADIVTVACATCIFTPASFKCNPRFYSSPKERLSVTLSEGTV